MISKAAVKLDDAIRMGCLYLIDICNLEYALYHQVRSFKSVPFRQSIANCFFQFFTLPSPGLRATLEGFCRLLYDRYDNFLEHLDC